MAGKQYSSNMRKAFGLQPMTTEEPPSEPDIQEPIQEPTPKRVEKVDQPKPTPEPVINRGAAQTSLRPAAKAGRPISTVERMPKTLAIEPRSDEALETIARQLQNWRGRKKGIPKVQQGEVADFAIEYLRLRIFEGLKQAEAFYEEQKEREEGYN
jgi:hypothetical protein